MDDKVKEFAEIVVQNPQPQQLFQSSTLADLFWQLEKTPSEALCRRLWWEAVQVQGRRACRRLAQKRAKNQYSKSVHSVLTKGATASASTAKCD